MGHHERAGKGRIVRIQDGDASQSWLPSQRMSIRTHSEKCSQETFRSLSCLRWNKGIALRVNLIPNRSQELQKDAATPTHHPSFPGPREEPRSSESPLPVLGFSAHCGHCSRPQAGIAASRQRSSSSASLLLLLQLSESLMAPQGATILRCRKGLWGKRPFLICPSLPHDPCEEQGTLRASRGL